MVRAHLAEPREARVGESETLEKKFEDGRPKELRIAGARAVPRPRDGEGKAASEPSRTLDRMPKAAPSEERCPSEAKHKPCRLERLPSAKAKDPKDPWRFVGCDFLSHILSPPDRGRLMTNPIPATRKKQSVYAHICPQNEYTQY